MSSAENGSLKSHITTPTGRSKVVSRLLNQSSRKCNTAFKSPLRKDTTPVSAVAPRTVSFLASPIPVRPSLVSTPSRCSASSRSAASQPTPIPLPSDTEKGMNIELLKKREDDLDVEISQLQDQGYEVSELDDHITWLHRYNDAKDAGQMLLGRIAVLKGVTTKQLYPDFGLDLDD